MPRAAASATSRIVEINDSLRERASRVAVFYKSCPPHCTLTGRAAAKVATCGGRPSCAQERIAHAIRISQRNGLRARRMIDARRETARGMSLGLAAQIEPRALRRARLNQPRQCELVAVRQDIRRRSGSRLRRRTATKRAVAPLRKREPARTVVLFGRRLAATLAVAGGFATRISKRLARVRQPIAAGGLRSPSAKRLQHDEAHQAACRSEPTATADAVVHGNSQNQKRTIRHFSWGGRAQHGPLSTAD
jgi:hypothetical protein